MNIPKKLSMTLYLYKLSYDMGYKWSQSGDMEMYDWELLATKEIEIETPEINQKELLQAKRDKLEEQKQKVLESKETEIAAIDDHLAALSKF